VIFKNSKYIVFNVDQINILVNSQICKKYIIQSNFFYTKPSLYWKLLSVLEKSKINFQTDRFENIKFRTVSWLI